MVAHPPRARAASTLLVAAFVALVAGCGVRLETPAPVELSPGAVEQVRARTVDEALELARAAREARDGVSDEDATAAVLDDVARFCDEHADAFGGVYDSGLPKPTPTGTPPAEPPATVGDVLSALHETSEAALDAAADDPDGPTARLLAAVGVARAELADRLTLASTVEVEPAPAATAAPEPTGLPEGLTADDVTALVAAHDQAGYGFEVVAARLSDLARAVAWSAAVSHREAAAEWLARGAAIGVADDPRRPTYALPVLPDEAAVRALAADLETAVADAAGAPIARLAAGRRDELVDLLRSSTAAARTWGAQPVAFPGLRTLG